MSTKNENNFFRIPLYFGYQLKPIAKIRRIYFILFKSSYIGPFFTKNLFMCQNLILQVKKNTKVHSKITLVGYAQYYGLLCPCIVHCLTNYLLKAFQLFGMQSMIPTWIVSHPHNSQLALSSFSCFLCASILSLPMPLSILLFF